MWAMLTAALASVTNFGDRSALEQRREQVASGMRHIRGGITSAPTWKKKVKARRRNEIAFESRRRNR